MKQNTNINKINEKNKQKSTSKIKQTRNFFSQTFGKNASTTFILTFTLIFSSMVIELQRPLLIFFMVNHRNQMLNQLVEEAVVERPLEDPDGKTNEKEVVEGYVVEDRVNKKLEVDKLLFI